MGRTIARALAVALTLQLVGVAPAVAAPPSYAIVDLGSPTSYSIAFGLSDTGVVVGNIEGTGTYDAFRWEAGSREILPALGDSGALARAIDPTGTIIVGESSTTTGTLAVGWIGADFGQLGSLPGPFSPYSSAYDVNSSMVAAGDSNAADGTTHAVRWDSSGITDLDLLVAGGNSHARGINELGQIVGDADIVPYGQYHAVVWDATGLITDLGALPGDPYSNGVAINDLGHIVGRSLGRPTGGQFGFFWDGAVMSEIPLLPGGSFLEVHAINGDDQVVGRGDVADGNQSAFLWEASTNQIVDLNSLLPSGSGWRLDEAFAINDAGQIAGYGIREGVIRAFLMTPSSDPAGTDYATGLVTPGGSLTTDPGTGATATDPVVTTVVSPNGGGVLIQEGVFDYPLSELTILGAQTRIGAPPATPEDPLRITFTFDASIIPVGEDESTIQVYRYGDPAGECPGSSQALPDPCVTARELLAGGDVRITVLTSHASIWSGVAGPDDTFDFSGFFAPVDNPPVYNVVKAGAAVPVKFGLGGDRGLSIFEAGYPAVRSISCDAAAPIDTLEQVAAAGDSGLQFDPETSRYTYVWKTSARWTGCKELVLRFTDGSEHVAHFLIRR